MKRLKSSDDLNSYGGEKGVFKDWGRKDDDSSMHQSSSHRSFHYKSESGKRGLSSSSSSRYERVEDDLKNPKLTRKRSDYDIDSYERRKSYDRYRDSSERGILSSSPRGGGYGGDRIHRSESFSGPRRDFPKGFRSERDRSRREGSVSSWRRFGGGKDVEESTKSGSDSARGSKAASEEVGNVRSPQGSGRDAKSPPWSKDSGSEQSKSLEVKKSESLPEESGNNSEREEGELDPDPEPIVDNITEHPPSEPLKHENPIDDKRVEEESKPDQSCIHASDIEEQVPVMNKVNESSTSEDSSTQRTGENEVAVPFLSDSQKKDPEQSQDCNNYKEEAKDASGISKPEEPKPKQVNDTNLEVKGENTSMDTNTQQQVTENEEQQHGFVNHSFVTKELTHNFKDKGKSVVVSVSSGNENGSSGLLNSREIDMEGPSTRGFDLFFTDPVKKSESIEQKGVSKPKDEKLILEPLELSLRLPSVLLPIGSQAPIQGPDSPSQEMSIQSHASSFQTSSDGFTLSRSFSGSQHYTHNPSCSLTENSFDFEQSVGSRPLFQGVTWQVQPPDDNHKNQNQELPIQMSLSNGNGIFHHSHSSQPLPNAQSLQLHTNKVSEGSYKLPIGLERQPSSNNKTKTKKHASGSQSVGSHETGSEHHKDRNRLMREGTDTVEPLLAMVVSDPVHIVSRILSEMTTSSLTSLKESTRDVISNPSKRRQFSTFRKALEKRSDLTLEILSKAHTTQVEILVALKTGIQDFLKPNSDTSSSDLAEIFLNIRCRNVTCRSYIPVDECDCKICVQKKGFCSACMCLVCSKFDMASNTCSWVGCDVCLHWCHTDCGIHKSYIRNGRSANRAPGQSQTEMQFHCVACDHPSEMFGFVREVFQNFAKGWTAETLANELEYVRRIFSASEDIRGKRLHEISLQMLTRLSDKSNVHQVRSFVMGFLTDDDSLKSENIQIPQEVVKPGYGERERAVVHLKAVPVIPREPVFDELDGIVRIKLAEAQMFQMRADDARREAEGLNRIALAKSKKIDEEFASRVTNLHFSEAEEIRRQKFEELQALENAHQEYFNMKLRMEREIKDLLLKMEATKRNFTSSS